MPSVNNWDTVTKSPHVLRYQLPLLLGVLLLCGLVYSNGLNGPLILDDLPWVAPIMDAHAEDVRILFANYLFSDSGNLGRPVSMASFIFNAMAHGDEIWYWKATNVVIHLASGMVVFFLARILLLHAANGSGTRDRVGQWAMLVTAIWLLHPLHVSTVLYTVQRMALLSSFFIFCGLLSYASGRQRQLAGGGRGWVGIAAGFLVFFPLALFSKENGLIFPLLVFLLEALVFRFGGTPGARRVLAGIFIVFLAIPAVAGTLYIIMNADAAILSGYRLREFTFSERLLTESRILVFYLYQLTIPMLSSMGFYHDDIVVSRSLLEPVTTVYSLLFLTGLLLLAWYLHRRVALAALGILFFFAAHLLESTIIPLELAYEHRNYLASFGVVLALVGVLAVLTRWHRVMTVAGLVLVVILTLTTTARAQIWRSYESLHTHAYAVRPESKTLITIVADSYANAGAYPQALALLEKYDNAGFRINRLYVACLEHGWITDQRMQAEAVALPGPIESQAVTGLIQLANLGLEQRCRFSSAAYLELLDRALALPVRGSNAQKLLMYKAHYLHRDGDLEAAVEALEQGYSHRQDNPVPLFLGVEWLLDAGQHERARKQFQRAMTVAHTSGRDYSKFLVSIENRLAQTAN